MLLTGKQLTTPVWIGILMLMGIVTKNAIMLVEFAVEAIREGKHARRRDHRRRHEARRPIVMTTIAMAAGMMPSALAFGAGGEFRSPMALAVIGGLLFSTVLSLVFVPAMFMMMDDIGALIWRFGKKLIVSHGENERRRADHHGEPPAKGPPAPPPPPAMASPRGGVRLAHRGVDTKANPRRPRGQQGFAGGWREASGMARCHPKDPRKGIKASTIEVPQARLVEQSSRC